jgi:hypothetical protein
MGAPGRGIVTMMVRLADLPIRTKLGLLVAIPLLGALALFLVIFLDVAEKAKWARALGSLEARNEREELFEPERLEKALEDALNGTKDLEQAAEDVMTTVSRFTEIRHEDWTLFLARRDVPATGGEDHGDI